MSDQSLVPNWVKWLLTFAFVTSLWSLFNERYFNSEPKIGDKPRPGASQSKHKVSASQPSVSKPKREDKPGPGATQSVSQNVDNILSEYNEEKSLIFVRTHQDTDAMRNEQEQGSWNEPAISNSCSLILPEIRLRVYQPGIGYLHRIRNTEEKDLITHCYTQDARTPFNPEKLSVGQDTSCQVGTIQQLIDFCKERQKNNCKFLGAELYNEVCAKVGAHTVVGVVYALDDCEKNFDPTIGERRKSTLMKFVDSNCFPLFEYAPLSGSLRHVQRP